MELQIPSFFPAFIPFLLLVFMVLKAKTSNKPNLPPGPSRIPIIGNMHQLIGFAPHLRLRDLAMKHGPDLMLLQLGQVPHVVVSSPEAAKEIMKTHDTTFAQRPHLLAAEIVAYNYKDIAFAPYGDYWRALRKLCTIELLSAKRVQSFRSIREEEVLNVMRVLSDASTAGLPINLTNMLKSLTSNLILRAAFGGSGKNQRDAFIALIRAITEVFSGFNVADFFPSIGFLHLISGMRPKLMKLHDQVDKLLESIMHEHKAAKIGAKKEADNLLDVLLHLQNGNGHQYPLTAESIKAILLDVFVAGVDTTSNTIDWVLSELVRHPQVMEKVQAEVRKVFHQTANKFSEASLPEMKYLSSVIKETLRLHPPVPLLLPREARESAKIIGYKIPIRTKVLINAWAIGRDPRFWNEPERFYPDRFIGRSIDYKGTDFEFIPFGSGRRSCPGMLFAVASVEATLANLLYHFDWKLPDGMKPEDLDMSEASHDIGKRRNDLTLIPVPHYPLHVN